VIRPICVMSIMIGACALVVRGGPLDPPPGPVAQTPGPEPRTPVSASTTPGDGDSLFKIVGPGSYYLTADVVGVADSHGIEIDSSGVSLDLNGFELRGAAGSLDGIRVSGFPENVEIFGGSIRGWGGSGIDGDTASSSSLRDLRAYDNGASGLRIGSTSLVVGCVARENGETGIFASNDCVVRNCAVRQSGGVGIEAFSGGAIVQCSSARNGAGGIVARAGSVVAACTSSFNDGAGVELSESSGLRDSVVRGNGLSGVLVSDGCLVSGNSVASNDGDGIRIDGDHASVMINICTKNGSAQDAGINLTGSSSYNRIESNTINDNEGAGVLIGQFATRNLIVRNIIQINSGDEIDVGNVNNFRGPSNSGFILDDANVNPWLNFVF